MKIVRKRVKLKNNSPLVYINLPASLSAVVAVFVRSGYRFDPKEIPGVSHFVEHMLQMGSKKYSTTVKLASALEKYGAWYEAWTYPDFNYFSVKTAKEFIDEAIENLLERLQHSLFRVKDIRSVKKVVLEELMMDQKNPESNIWNIWNENIWQKTVLGGSYLGTKESIRQIKKETLLNFFKKNYLAKNSVFFYAGANKFDEILPLFNKNIDGYNRKANQEIKRLNFQREEPIKIFHSQDEQLTMAFGFKTASFFSKDYNALDLFQTVLGRGWSSRIGEELRSKQGLVYEWDMNHHQFIDSGYIMFQASVYKDNLNRVLKLICKEIGRIKDHGVSKRELDKNKGYYIGSLLSDIETPLDFIQWYGRQELFKPKSVVDIKQQCEAIKRVSSKEVQAAAQKYFTNDNWFLSIIGDIKKKDIDVLRLEYFLQQNKIRI